MLRRRMKSERGAAIVEFALVVPILFALVFGIAEFGYAFFVKSTISGAAREGVREMALANPPGNGPAKAIAAVHAAAPGYTVNINTGALCPPTGAGQATVTVKYSLEPMTKMFFVNPITLTGIGVMRCNG
jgi:Flp pilus assembly protein TadG